MYECFICSPAAAALELFFSVVAGHPFKAWISAVVQNKDGEGEGHRRRDERMRWESLVERERERGRGSFASLVWQIRSGPGASLGTVPTRRQCCGQRCLPPWREVRLFPPHLHAEGLGSDTAGGVEGQ